MQEKANKFKKIARKKYTQFLAVDIAKVIMTCEAPVKVHTLRKEMAATFLPIFRTSRLRDRLRFDVLLKLLKVDVEIHCATLFLFQCSLCHV